MSDPLDALSLGLALMLGTAGLPHILMRFYTVPDARTARSSVTYATAFIGFFYLLTFILGFGAMVIVGQPAIRAIDAGGNMAAPLLAEAVGGEGFLGFIAAVAFATILAVVAGLTLAGAAALSHDLWVNVVRARRGAGARAAARRPRLDGPARHPRDRARHRVQGAERGLHGGAGVRDRGERELPGAAAVGVLAAVHDARRRRRACWSAPRRACSLIYLSPTIQIDILGNTAALFPLRNPGLVSIPLSFAVAIGVALAWPEPAAAAGYAEVERRVHVAGRSAAASAAIRDRAGHCRLEPGLVEPSERPAAGDLAARAEAAEMARRHDRRLERHRRSTSGGRAAWPSVMCGVNAAKLALAR